MYKSKMLYHLEYIVTGQTTSKKLLKLKDTHPEVEHVIQTCIAFRKMLHAEKDAPGMDDWLKDARFMSDVCHFYVTFMSLSASQIFV